MVNLDKLKDCVHFYRKYIGFVLIWCYRALVFSVVVSGALVVVIRQMVMVVVVMLE